MWRESGALMQEMMQGIEQSLGMPQCVFDNIVVPECTMPEGAADRAETLLCMFRYECRSETDDIAAPHDVEASGKGCLVSEPHRDLGLLSLVIGASPGLKVFNTTLGGWVPIKQPPRAGPGLTATLLVSETLTILTNGQYAAGQHHVFVPSVASSLSSADNLWYWYSLMFALHPHQNAIISTQVLTTPMTGAYCYKFILIFNGVTAKIYFIEVAACMRHLISNRCMRVVESWEFGCLLTVAL